MVTTGTLAALAGGSAVFARTQRHPAASVLDDLGPDVVTYFDDVYETADDDGRGVRHDRRAPGRRSPARHRRRAGGVRRPRFAAGGRAHGAAAAGRRAGRGPRSSRRCRSSTWRGCVSASIPSRPACGWSTATGSPSTPLGPPERCSSASATPSWCCATIKLALEEWPDEPVVVIQRLGLPDESITEVAVGRARPGRRRPPHVGVRPEPRRAGRRRARPVRRAGAHATRRLPVGPRADPRVAHAPPARGELRGARGDRRVRRRHRRRRRRPVRGAGRRAVPGVLPRHDRHRGGVVHARRRGPGRARQAPRPSPPRVRRRRLRERRAAGRELGGVKKAPRRRATR